MNIKKLLARFSQLSTLSLKARLAGVLGLLCLMLIIGAAVGLGVMKMQNEGTRQIYEDHMVPINLMASARQSELKSYIALDDALRLMGKPDQMKQKVDAFRKDQAQVADMSKQFAALPRTAEVDKLYKAWTATDGDMASNSKDLLDAMAQKDDSAGDLLDMQLQPIMLDRLDKLQQMLKMQKDEAQQIYQGQVRRYKVVSTITLIALVLGLAVALVAAFLLIRSITSTLSQAVKIANAIAEGRLVHDIQVTRHDELGQLLRAFQQMDERLAAIVGEVRQGSEAVNTAAKEIARGNDDLSQRTQEQASSLEETASSMEEMTSTVKQNAENASHANQLARGAREQAEHGGEVAHKAVAAMAEIDASSKKIGEIVGLIQDIAFQTNLLALNAAVEAARAGEQGRGFAVVASEVRSLAQRSAGAAKEIKGLINESEAKVKTGSELVNQSGKALAEIVDSVKKVTDIVAEIAAASQEQSAGIDQVNNAVMQMDEMTQQNAALVEQASAAARAMQDQASDLTSQVSFFQVGAEGGAAGHGAGAPKAESRPAPKAAPSRPVPTQTVRVAPAARKASLPAVVAESSDAGAWKEF